MSGAPGPAQVIGIANAAIGLFLALLLPFLRSGPLRARLMLVGVFLAISQFQAGAVFEFYGGYQAHPHLTRIGSTGFFLVGPCLYLYIRGLARPGQRLQGRDLLHLLPLAWEVLRRLPFFLAPADQKMLLLQATRSSDLLWNRLGYLVVMAAYLVALVPLLRAHERELREQQSSLAGRHLLWGFGLMVAWSVGPALTMLLQGHPAASILVQTTPYWHLALLVLTAILMTTRPVLEDAAAPVFEAGPAEAADPAQGGTPGPDREADLIQRVQACMERDQPWREPDLSLAALARRLRVAPAALSRALNGRLGMNFFTFVNRYRVEAALLRLRDPSDPATVLEIALASGFASKSTFNDTFKRLTGRTPREVRGGSPESGG